MPLTTRAPILAAALLGATLTPSAAGAQDGGPGRAHFERLCAACHGGDGRGGERGPAIVGRMASRDDEGLKALVRGGLPGAGMPGLDVPDGELQELVAFLRALQARDRDAPPRVRVPLADGSAMTGAELGRTRDALQVLGDDRRIALLRRDGDRYRRVTSQADWPTYHGQYNGNRHSPLDRIDTSNVSRLAPAWTFPIAGSSRLQVTPLVVDGIMYVTAANECYALDAGTGRQLWHYRRPRTRGLAGDAAAGINRGAAVAGDRVFMVTDHAHLIALDRFTGALLWETEMADYRQNYGATSAPLAVGDRVITGTSGGDEGVRGFVAAFDQETGREVWRFWTVPAPGEPGSETWQGSAIAHGCAAAWFTGTYDPDLDTLYWPTGNPCPDYDGSQRKGDNLYSDSILALDPATGRLKWHFQYTPHDLWDWDAQQPAVLADVEWEGRPRKLLLHANRNGFFYVLDRTDGTLLRATPFVEKLTWARGIDAGGRPVLNDNQIPTPDGTVVCPAVEGATNWFSTAFHPGTGLYYVQALEKCSLYTLAPEDWQAGRSYYGGTTRRAPDDEPRKILRAIDVRTGETAWDLPQSGPGTTWGGVLSTAGGLVFAGDDSGALIAADARTGELLWQFPANVLWKASPMTYLFDGRQYVAVAAGSTIVAFALVP